MDTALLCLSILNELRKIREQLKENYATCIRLYERAETFRELLEELQNKQSASTTMLVKPMMQLKRALEEVKNFVVKFTENKIWRKFVNAVSCKEHAGEIKKLNGLLNECVLTLLPSQQADSEQRRREDIQDFKDLFEVSVQRMIDDIAVADDGSKNRFEKLFDEINENKTTMNYIVHLLEHRSLSIEEEKIEEARIGRLMQHAEQRQREVMQRLSELNSKIEQIKILMESGLEKKRREEILSGRRLSHGVVEVSPTVIGQGAFGSVHLGRYNSREVAVKCVDVHKHSKSQDLTSIESELILMYLIDNHPSILTVYGYLEDLTCGMQIVMELSPYGSLDKVLYNREKYPDIPVLLSLSWLCDIASALAHLHSRKVKHRDVKAENVLLFYGFHSKLCDFGLSKQHFSETLWVITPL